MEKEVFARAPPKEDWTSFRYCQHVLDEDDLASIDHSKTKEYMTIRDNSSSQVTQLSQPILEGILRKHAQSASKQFKDAQILFHHTLVDLNLKERVARVSGPNGLMDIEANLVIGVDGGKSQVREFCGISIQGKTFLESFTSVHFTSKKLAQFLRTRRKSAMLTFVFNPSVIAAVFVVHDVREDGNFVTHLPFFPPAETPEQFQGRDVIEPLVRSLLGELRNREQVDVQIKSMRSWGMHATIADTFCSKDGWVALAGDAAHQYPPAGGFGVNVGLSEIDYLVNQILVSGPIPEAVKDYSWVRRPIAAETLRVALNNYKRGLLVTSALGLEKRAVTLLSNGLRNPILPSYAASRLLRKLAQPPVQFSLIQPQRILQVKQVVERDQDALPLYFPKVDLGANLRSGLLEEVEKRWILGRLVPHAWLSMLSEKQILSTRDLSCPLALDSSSSLKPLTRFLLFTSAKGALRYFDKNLFDETNLEREKRVLIVRGTESDISEGLRRKLVLHCTQRKLILTLDRNRELMADLKENHVMNIQVGPSGFVNSTESHQL